MQYVTLEKDGHKVKVVPGGSGEAQLLAAGFHVCQECEPISETPVTPAETITGDLNPAVESNPATDPGINSDEEEYIDFLEKMSKVELREYAFREFEIVLDGRRNKQELIQEILEAAKKKKE